jgi:hypothetical protein
MFRMEKAEITEFYTSLEFIDACKEFVKKNKLFGDLTINIHGPFIFNYKNITFIKKCNSIYEKQYITNELDIFLDSFGIDYHN